MNKKWAIRLTFSKIIVIVFLILVFALILSRTIFNKPGYKIEKPNCQDYEITTNLFYYFGCYENFCKENNNESCKQDCFNNAINFTKDWIKNLSYKGIEQSCEMQEVDEIKFTYKSDCESFCKRNKEEINDCYNLWGCENKSEEYIPHENAKISKEDLTKEWLDENCECLEKDIMNIQCEKGYKPKDSYCISEENCSVIYPQCMKCKGIFNQDCYGGETYPSCSKYKCGDYIIEVRD